MRIKNIIYNDLGYSHSKGDLVIEDKHSIKRKSETQKAKDSPDSFENALKRAMEREKRNYR